VIGASNIVIKFGKQLLERDEVIYLFRAIKYFIQSDTIIKTLITQMIKSPRHSVIIICEKLVLIIIEERNKNTLHALEIKQLNLFDSVLIDNFRETFHNKI